MTYTTARGVQAFDPGCGCICCKPFFLDDFNRYELLGPPAHYDPQPSVASWPIVDGELAPNVANARLLKNTTQFPGPQSAVVRVDVKGDQPGDKLQVYPLMSGTLDDSRLGAEIEFGQHDCATLRLFYHLDTTIVVREQALGRLPLDTFHTIQVCFEHNDYYEPHRLTAQITHADGLVTTIEAEFHLPEGTFFFGSGLGTGDTVNGSPRFDNFAMIKHADQQAGCPNCRPPTCLLNSDDFHRDPYSVLAQDCFWQLVRVFSQWDFGLDELIAENLGAGRGMLANVIPHPRSVRLECSISVPAGGWGGLFIGEISGGAWIGEFTADYESDCGWLRIVNLSAGGEEAIVGPTVRLKGILPDEPVAVSLCYSHETRVLTATVGGQSTHARDVGPFEYGARAGLASFGEGVYHFRTWRMYQGRDAEHPQCPSCCGGGCSHFVDEFETDPLDCRWQPIVGIWTPAAGPASTINHVETSDSGALMVWNQSWPGVAEDLYGDCGVDLTATGKAIFLGHSYGDQFRVAVDYKDPDNYHFGQVTLAADASDYGPSRGKLAVFKVSGGAAIELASKEIVGLLPGSAITLRVCFLGETIQAMLEGLDPELVSSETTRHNGQLAGIGTGNVGYLVECDRFETSHDLFSSDCEDCFDLGGGVCQECYGEVPALLLGSLSGAAAGTGESCPSGVLDLNPDLLNRSWLLPFAPFSIEQDCCRWGVADFHCPGPPWIQLGSCTGQPLAQDSYYWFYSPHVLLGDYDAALQGHEVFAVLPIQGTTGVAGVCGDVQIVYFKGIAPSDGPKLLDCQNLDVTLSVAPCAIDGCLEGPLSPFCSQNSLIDFRNAKLRVRNA